VAKLEPHAAGSVPGLIIRLEKRIPMGAGLGGGSSDGARTLQALNVLWALHWPAQKLAAIAATLGSDLPFFFHGPGAICRGRGELVEPISPPQSRFAGVRLSQRFTTRGSRRRVVCMPPREEA
jgi:4-diphosphocytidyl-2-C-methyl-D-erythritol kinase